jgi:sporulation-control protein spo0M
MTFSDGRIVKKKELFSSVPPFKGSLDLRAEIDRRRKSFDRLVVVIDDDPTGIQTVHDVDVYFSWEKGALEEAFRKENLVFVHTNVAQTRTIYVTGA